MDEINEWINKTYPYSGDALMSEFIRRNKSNKALMEEFHQSCFIK
tara:strand:+ start:1303 stop:1437 length:135 start_codon:yes stop_codon:yes gene_type:complete